MGIVDSLDTLRQVQHDGYLNSSAAADMGDCFGCLRPNYSRPRPNSTLVQC